MNRQSDPSGTPVKGLALTVRPTPERAVLFAGERRARLTAMHNGWSVVLQVGAAAKCLCPACRVNPLGIRLPPPGLDM